MLEISSIIIVYRALVQSHIDMLNSCRHMIDAFTKRGVKSFFLNHHPYHHHSLLTLHSFRRTLEAKLNHEERMNVVDNHQIEAANNNGRLRTFRACQRCRVQKLKCSGGAPCERCLRLHVTCKDGSEAKSITSDISFPTAETKLHSALRRISELEASVESINLRLAHHETARDPASLQSTPFSTKDDLPSSSAASNFPAPFSDVAFDRSTLENRQETRAPSPEDGVDAQDTDAAAASRRKHKVPIEYHHQDTLYEQSNKIRKMGTLGPPSERPLDPINEGVISIERAERLINFFFENCLTYVPLFDSRRLPTIEEMRKSDLCLFCSIIAIAARHTAAIDPSFSAQRVEEEWEDLCQIVEAHVAKTLVRPRHRLGDIQAIILLHSYGLRSGGIGHDPWILSGHAFRLAKRLSIDRITTLQGITKSLSQSTSLPRRSWLLLCASDCFPSLGFGRPASPRENLESCAPLASLLAEQYGQKCNLHADGEWFIASQVELAFISRRLMDWVTQTNFSSSRASDLRAIAHKYDLLVDQLDTCQLRWDSAKLGTAEQWNTSRLFRLHVRLCLATFTMRLGQTAISNGDNSKKRKNINGRSTSGIDSTRSQEINSRLQQDCSMACLNSAKEMIEIHKEARLTFLPDYLITALSQAIITSIGIIEIQQQSGQRTKSEANSLAQNFIDDAQSTLSRFAVNQTGLAQFLIEKVLERAKRSHLLDAYNNATATWHEDPLFLHKQVNVQTDGEGERTVTWNNQALETPRIQTNSSAAAAASDGQAIPSTSAANVNIGQNSAAPDMHNVDFALADIDMWLNTHGTSSDPALQWNGQFWNGDDPLQLLFGMNSAADHLWPTTSKSSDTGDSVPGGVITAGGGTTTSPF